MTESPDLAPEEAPAPKPKKQRKPRRKAEPVTVTKGKPVVRTHAGILAVALGAAGGDRSRIKVIRPGVVEIDRTGLDAMWVPPEVER